MQIEDDININKFRKNFCEKSPNTWHKWNLMKVEMLIVYICEKCGKTEVCHVYYTDNRELK